MSEQLRSGRPLLLASAVCAVLAVFIPASLFALGRPFARLFDERGSLTSAIGNVTYLGSGTNSYFVSFVTPLSDLTANGLPIPSLLFVNCANRDFDGAAAFEPSNRKYVKELVDEFCGQMKKGNLLNV